MARNDPRLRDGIAVVSGADGALGRALAVELCQRDVRTFGLGRAMAGLQKTADHAGAGFTPLEVDLDNYRALRTAFARITLEVGPPTLVITHAPRLAKLDLLSESTESVMRAVQTNLGGTVACTHAALRSMLRAGFGRILHLGCAEADLSPAVSLGAQVSVAAAQQFSELTAQRLADRHPGIVINSWQPDPLPENTDPKRQQELARMAGWGVDLALWHDPGLSGSRFAGQREALPTAGARRKLARMLHLSPRPRRL